MPPQISLPSLFFSAPNPWTPSILARGGLLRWFAASLAVALGYFALGSIVDWFFSAYGLFPAPIWLPASVGVVAAMAGGVRLLPAIFLGSFLTNHLLFAPPVHVSLIISATNAIGPVAGALLLRGLRPTTGLFMTFAGVMAFLGCTICLHPAISATGGALALSIGGPLEPAAFYSIWVNWWLTDAGGTLYLAPSVILWLGLERETGALARRNRPVDRQELAVWGCIAAVSAFMFLTPPFWGSYGRAAFPFLLVVALSWVALRMSLRSAYTLVTFLSIIATVGTVAGLGPFQSGGSVNPLQQVGTLVVLLAMNVLAIVALVSERQEAQNASRMKSMFLAKTSHELRTPLNAILGFSSLIDTQAVGPIPNKEYTDYARIIHSSGEHLLALINDLLDMTKIEAGRFTLDEELVSLPQAIEQAVGLVGFEAHAKSITLRTAVSCGDLAILVDARVFRQILLNLLSNAIKFTPDGGEAGVAVTRSDDGDLVIRVYDTGIGIPADALESVFIPFERAQRDAIRKIEGTGLGLSITRGLVALHGGTIKLQSVVDQGTVVTVTLPAERVADGTAAAMPLAAAG